MEHRPALNGVDGCITRSVDIDSVFVRNAHVRSVHFDFLLGQPMQFIPRLINLLITSIYIVQDVNIWPQN